MIKKVNLCISIAIIFLFAQSCDLFIKPSYSVTFDSNGGSSVAASTVQEGSTLNSPTSPTKTGYAFVDWYSNENLSNQFDFDTPITENITLYAKWDTLSYNITYNLNGGTSSTTDQSSYTILSDDFDISSVPTKTDCTFEGWYVDSSLSKPITTVLKGSTGDLNLYAKWLQKISNSSGAADDYFGHSVSIDGNNVIAANKSYNNEPAYIYEIDGANNSLSYDEGLTTTAEDITYYYNYSNGYTVDIDGDLAVVVDSYYDGSIINGPLLVYQKNSDSWTELYSLSSFQYGFMSVSVSGGTIIAGSDVATGDEFVHIFKQGDDNTWSDYTLTKIHEYGEDMEDYGEAVAIDGNHAAVGAPRNEKIYNYQINSDDISATEKAIYKPSGVSEFGNSIAISGDYALVGATGGNGSVCLYQIVDDEWNFIETITASDGSDGDGFGSSVAICGDSIIVGAPNSDENKGCAYLYHIDSDDVSSTEKKITAISPTANDFFGNSVSISDTTAIIGAQGTDSNKGCVYMLR